MKSKRNLFTAGSLVFFLTFLLWSVIAFKNTYRVEDFQFLTVVINNNTTTKSQILLIDKPPFITQFISKANNLGQVAVRFNTFRKVNDDKLRFTLIEVGKTAPYYSAIYKTDQFQNGKLFPFGFPTISDSKNKKYEINISSTKGNINDKVEVINDGIITKHTYIRSELKSPISVLDFLVSKASSMAFNLTTIDVFMLFTPLVFFLLLFFINKSLFNIVLIEWSHLCSVVRTRVSLKRYISWNRRWEIEMVLFYCYFFWYAIAMRYITQLPLIIPIQIPLLVFFLSLIVKIKVHKIINFVKTHFLLLIPTAIFSVIRLTFFDHIPHWDGNIFVNEIRSSTDALTVSLTSLGKDYFWGGGHPTMGYGSYMSIGQLFFPNNLYIIHLQNLILGVMSIIAFYGITRILLKRSSLTSSLLTLLFAINPLFIATSLTPNMDYPVLCFFVIALYFLLKDKLVLFAFISALMVLSKEVGFMLYLMLLMGLLAPYIAFKVGFLDKYFKRITKSGISKSLLILGYILYLVFPISVFGFQYLASGGTIWNGNYYVKPYISFLFHPLLFFPRIFEVSVMNFAWILTIIILIGFIKYFRKNKFKVNSSMSNAISLSLTCLLFVGVNCFYNTFTHPRYLIVSVFFISILSAYGLVSIKKSVRYLPIGIITVLFFFSIYYTIDPVSKFVFGTFSWGNKTLLKIGDPIQARCDSMVYNTEFIYIDRLYQKFRKQESQYIGMVISNELNGVDGTQNWWMRHFDYSPTMVASELSKNVPDGNVYYLFLPWLSENIDNGIDTVKKYYSIEETGVIEQNGYWLRFYKLKKLVR